MSIPKLICVLKVIFLGFLFYSCNENLNKNNNILKVEKNGNLLFYGEVDNSDNPIGVWNFLNSEGKTISTISFTGGKNNFAYEIKQYDSNGKEVYTVFYEDGKVLEEKKCDDFYKINYENGRYLYDSYLEPFLDKTKLDNYSESDFKRILNEIRTNNDSIIPVFSKNEILSILEYLNTNKKVYN